MNDKKSGITVNFTFGTVLFLIFLVLKLMKVIAWSWWWVFAPIWIPIIITFLIVLALNNL